MRGGGEACSLSGLTGGKVEAELHPDTCSSLVLSGAVSSLKDVRSARPAGGCREPLTQVRFSLLAVVMLASVLVLLAC